MLPINSPLRMLTGRPPRPHGHRPHGRFGVVFVVVARRRRDLSTKPWTGHQVKKVFFFFFCRRKCGRDRRPNFKIGRRKETVPCGRKLYYSIYMCALSGGRASVYCISFQYYCLLTSILFLYIYMIASA
jgi:hypothetical protein